MLLKQPWVIHVNPCLGLLHGNARLPPRQHCQKRIIPVVQPIADGRHLPLHGHGYKNVRCLSHLDAAESCLRNADNGHFRVVHQNRLIQHSGIPAEMPRPIAMAKDQDGMGALDIVIGRRQHSAEGRPHAQHLEIIPGHQFARATVGLSVARNGGGKLIARHHAVKNSRVFC